MKLNAQIYKINNISIKNVSKSQCDKEKCLYFSFVITPVVKSYPTSYFDRSSIHLSAESIVLLFVLVIHFNLFENIPEFGSLMKLIYKKGSFK